MTRFLPERISSWIDGCCCCCCCKHIHTGPPVRRQNIVRALYDFDAVYDGDISFRKDDTLEVISRGDDNDDDWWLARHVDTRREGYIPSNYVIIDDDKIESQDWWHSLNLNETRRRLMTPGNPKGSFLVRNSSDRDAYTLSIVDRDDDNIDQPILRHVLIRKMDDGHSVYIFATQIFSSLVELIDFYRQPAENTGSNVLPCQLTAPCPREIPPIPFKELEIKESDIVLAERIGYGSSGDIYAGKFRGVVDVAVRVALPDVRYIISDPHFSNAAEVTRKLRHRKLVQLHGICRSPTYVVTERMSNGALLDYLLNDGGDSITFEVLIDMAVQVADGMSYLESKRFVHGDLRAANVLVGDQNVVKVADFGLARLPEDDNEDVYWKPDSNFPIKWAAPETFATGKFTVESDVWSFGVVLYEMVTYGRSPYPGMDKASVAQHVPRGYRMRNPHGRPSDRTSSVTVRCPDDLYQTMLKCWDQQPEHRPTFESLKRTLEDYPLSLPDQQYWNINDES